LFQHPLKVRTHVVATTFRPSSRSKVQIKSEIGLEWEATFTCRGCAADL